MERHHRTHKTLRLYLGQQVTTIRFTLGPALLQIAQIRVKLTR